MSHPARQKTLYRVLFVSLVILSLLSGIVIFISTTNGPRGYSDSVSYIVSARNLLKGFGLGMFTPSGRFVVTYLHPPLYSLFLSAIGFWGIDLVDAARWSNIVLCSVTVFMTGFIFLRYSRSPEVSMMAGLLVIFFPTILFMFTLAMSEPLFLFLLSCSGLLLINYLQKQTTKNLVVSSLFCGLLPVTRYVGISIIVSAVICVFFFSTGSWWERLKRSFVFGVLASLPLMIWMAVLYLGSGYAMAGRGVEIRGEQLAENFHTYRAAFLEILWNWMPFRQIPPQIPYRLRYFILMVVFLVISSVTWVAGRSLVKRGEDIKYNPDAQISIFFGMVAVSYIVVFTASWLFTIPPTPVNDRLLLPIYFGAMVGSLGCLAIWQDAWLPPKNLFLRAVPWLVTAILLAWYYPQSMDVITQMRKQNTVTAYKWENSRMISALKKMPADQPIISNKSELVMMWVDRAAYDLMENLNPDFIDQNSPYGSDETDAAQQIFRQGAVLAVFDGFPYQLNQAYGRQQGNARLETIFDGLTIVGQFPDGTIYTYPPR